MEYPNVLRRYLATVIDFFVLWCIVYAFSRLPNVSESSTLVYWVLGLSLLLYEPLLTTYACTLGQMVMRVRVRTPDGLRRVRIDQAIGRTVVKYLLGIISFLTVPARKDRRAIHDLASGTIVFEAAKA
ncbi:RDD family protein [Povalibacter sp.]|uniref:RDD family protein n=1 Tax=Povalibacter sp. TaxID=1962978 RepID=UPI002F3E9715